MASTTSDDAWIDVGNGDTKDHQSYAKKSKDRLKYSYKVTAGESQKNGAN